MSRSRKRSKRSHQNTSARLPSPTGESLRSQKYEAGMAVRYKYRIHGPKFPVQTLTISDLPEGSSLI